MTYTYPAAPASVTGDAITVHKLLKSPTLLATRLRTILMQRYIADAILTGRFTAEGGSVAFESGEPIGTLAEPRSISAGAEFPIVQIGSGVISTAMVDEWGQDALVTYRAIRRMKIDPVNRALSRLAAANVQKVDKVALGVVSSVVPTFRQAPAAWSETTSADVILTQVLGAKTDIESSGDGFSVDTVVLDPQRYLFATLAFIRAGYLPREAAGQNPVMTGEFPQLMGLRWLASPHSVANTVIVEDSTQLGGMADEPVPDPGYVSASEPGATAVQVKSINEENPERYRVRAKRPCVPVVLEPAAGRKITGV